MIYFEGKWGESHVKGHQYSISTKDGKSIDRTSQGIWDSVVKKRTELVMSMIVRKVALDDKGKAWAQRSTCPHCYKTELGVMADEGWLHW